MGLFICEKCGCIDNTACANTYYIAKLNRHKKEKGEKIKPFFKPEFEYFENHACCTECCKGIECCDGIKFGDGYELDEREHWSKYGKEELLEWESRRDGSMVNATEYFMKNDI